MNIGIFSESYHPVRNGVAVSVATLAEGLIKNNNNVYIFAPDFKKYKDKSDNIIRFPSFFTPMDPEYPIPYPFFPGMLNRVKNLNIDVIHTQTPWQLGWLGMKIARKLHIPIVSTNHTKYVDYAHYFPLAPKSLTKAFIINLMKNYYNACDEVVTPSKQVADTLIEYGVNKSIHVIPTGISIQMFKNQAKGDLIRNRYKIPENDIVILYTGRLAKEKNLSLLFESFDCLANDNSNIWLMFVGNGPAENTCKQTSQKSKYRDRIILTGSVPRNEIVNYYSAGDIFAFPSLTDTQGLVICEALQSGLPCVGVRAGGTPEMITENEDGFLTENNVTDFTEKIKILINDKSCRMAFSEKAVSNSMRFTVEKMAQNMIDIYNLAIANTSK